MLDERDVEPVRSARERLERSTFVLAVVGEFSSGKSFLLNTLLGEFHAETYGAGERITGLLATDINPSTATITHLTYGPERTAYACYEDGREDRIPIDRLSTFVAAQEDPPDRVIVHLTSPFLQRGFSIADTPGLASVNPAHRRATLRFLPSADAVLYLIDTQQPFTEGDAAFLEIVRAHVETIFIVQTKIDLWEQRNGEKAAWEAAYERILQQAAIHAPNTYVYPVSALQFAQGTLSGDETLIAQSRFPDFLAALNASLVQNTGRARLRLAVETAREAGQEARARIALECELLERNEGDLRELLARKSADVERAAQFAAAERARIDADLRNQHVSESARAQTLADEAQRALAQAFDVTDVARLRDRARLHMLIDRTLSETVSRFAQNLAVEQSAFYGEALSRANDRFAVRFSFAQAAAAAFGANAQSSFWREDPAQALCAAIVLEALGGPAIALAQAIAARFAGAPPGAYMKRELAADLKATLWPAFQEEMLRFAGTIEGRMVSIAQRYELALDGALIALRDGELGSIKRALDAHAPGADPQSRANELHERSAAIACAITRLEAPLALVASGEERVPNVPGSEAVLRAHAEAVFDREVYQQGLRPQRWRVAVVGALRRGKSSLINTFAGRRVLGDEVAGTISYPVHVRYGEQETAFSLAGAGTWNEIEIESAMEEATRNPVLILTPWNLPRELVLVHVPAFDAGGSTLEDICLVAARHASEVLCLFSRQLSDRELDLYARIAEIGKPMLFAHTLADNESGSERRHVVELAQEYLRERGIPASRLFTLSTLEYAQARREGRAPAGWNEVDALMSTVAAHAQEHMSRLERLARAVAKDPAPSPAPEPTGPAHGLAGRLAKWWNRS